MPRTLLLLTAGALAASLGIKASLPPAARVVDRGATAGLLQRAAAKRGYAATLASAGAGIPLVVARYQGCRRRLFLLHPDGSDAAKVESLRQPGDRGTFHYLGKERTRLPRFGPVVRDYVQAYLGNFGMVIAVPPVVAELSAGDCRGAPVLPFAALRVAVKSASD